jgi:hypothetical protein
MIQVQNSRDHKFKHCYKIVTSEICALLQKSLQSNAVCERMHQTVGNILRTLLHGNPLQNIASAAQYVDEALLIAIHTMQAGVHST